MRVSYSLLLSLASASASAAPVLLPTDCHHTSCSSLKASLLTSKPNTPPTTLTKPHFPSHQLSASALIDGAFDNTPITPSSNVPHTSALTAIKPLTSTYLLSLTHPFSSSAPQSPPQPSAPDTSSTENLPSKPTSALPALRREDARRYWESLRGAGGKNGPVPVNMADSPKNVKHICGIAVMNERVRISGVRMTRDYSDLMVVAIVVLFLAVVVALEAVEKMGDLREILTNTRRRKGEIYLSDDEDVLIVRKPFFLQAAPPPRYKVSTPTYNEKDIEEFKYDSEAFENV